MEITITRLHQVVQERSQGRRIVVLNPGSRIDGTREINGEQVAVAEITHLKRLLDAEGYAALVASGVIDDPAFKPEVRKVRKEG